MDMDQLATIVRPIATVPSRRFILRALVSLAVGTALAPLVSTPETLARKKRKGKKKRPKKTLRFCANGRRKCGGACVDTTVDPAHCGGCDKPCGEGQVCTDSVCFPGPATCSDGVRNGEETDIDCGGSCPAACANDKTCAADPDCQSGHCVSEVCRECGTAAHCGTGRDCIGGNCCTVDGFGSNGVCVTDDECCSGNCVTYQQAYRTCRPAGCIPPGGSCLGGTTTCCSWTCSGDICS